MARRLNNIPTRSGENTLYRNNKSITSRHNQPIVIGSAGAANLLEVCYPMGFNEATSKHTPWVAAIPTTMVVSLVSASSGTFTITVNGIATGTIVYNPTAGAVEAALRAIGVIASVVEGATDVFTITFDDPADIASVPTVTGDVGSISGGSPTAVPTAGTSTNGAHRIRGFINPNDVTSGITVGSVALTRVTTLATAVQSTPHGLKTGMLVDMTSVAPFTLSQVAITVPEDPAGNVDPYTFTFPVADSGSASSTGTYTTTDDVQATMMTKGDVLYSDVADLIAAGSLTALMAAMRADLMPDGLIVQGLTAVH